MLQFRTTKAGVIVNTILLAVLLLCGTVIAEAKEKQVFKFACMFPDSHLRAKAWKTFCDKVEATTDGQVVFKMYTAESLVKAMQEYEAVRMGAIDISGSPTVYITGYQPVCLFADIPGYAKSYSDAMDILKKVMPILDKEFEKAGIKLLWGHPATMFDMCCNNKGGFIKSMDDFKGLKGRIAGGYSSEAFRIWGGAPVTLPTAEQYTALQYGTVDATYIGTDSYSSYKLWEVAPLVTKFQHPLYYHLIKMNMKAWKKISPEDQEKILSAGKEMMDSMPSTFVQEQDDLYKTMAEHGSKFFDPPEELKNAMSAAVKPLWEEYLKKTGEPGQKIYEIISADWAAK